ncbi:aromatic amino acid lyase [Psychromicrobium sp. YIM B11713]|uniref:aromatic amino acid lyase n=1 Tax=Psychromicrobium sp. YIM B11713 TaxID=3145233 RepID=UPI00374FCC45
MTFVLDAGRVSLAAFLEAVADEGQQIEITPAAWQVIHRARELVERTADSGELVYGLNTLLGSGRNTEVQAEQLLAYQVQVVRYHASGVGSFLSKQESRSLILARLVGLSRGGAGVHRDAVEQYLQLLNRGVHPAIPRIGSVGSSDLTQLAALASVAIGEGEAFDDAGELITGAQALQAVGLRPLALRPLEGLALISANSYSIGVGALLYARLEHLAEVADTALAVSLEAVGRYADSAGLGAYSAVIAAAKDSPGTAASSARIRGLLRGSELGNPERRASVQDPLSFRSAPQTHGALRRQLGQLAELLDVELNARAENPLVDLESGSLHSGGNFQIVELALSFESIRIALAHIGIISERRIAKLYPPQRLIRQAKLAESQGRVLPEELPGLLWYSAAALLAELKTLAQPVTLGAPSLSADVEDHSTLAPLALQHLQRSVEVLEQLLSIELLTAVFLLVQPGVEAGAGALGLGVIELVHRLEPLLQQKLSAATLVDRAREELFRRVL